MKISELYPSKYIKAAHLAAGPKTFTVKAAAVEQVGPQQEPKLVVRFSETTSGFIVNKTNSKVLGEKLGDDTDAWAGHTITLAAATGKSLEGTPFNTVTVIAADAKAPSATKSPESADDDVPF